MGFKHVVSICILFLITFARASILDYLAFGTSKNHGPITQEGECSQGVEGDYTGPYYSSPTGTGQKMFYTTNRFTAVHRTLPPGSYAKVTNEYNNKSIVVEIVGSGPLVEGRIMELSPAAFCQISRESVTSCFVRATTEYPPTNFNPGTECQSFQGYPAPPSSVYSSSSAYEAEQRLALQRKLLSSEGPTL